jgi:hypothetical protein
MSNLHTGHRKGILYFCTLAIVVSTLGLWLFVNNAENCLTRDFVEHALPAVCWKAQNDYEDTIRYGDNLLALCIKLIIISVTSVISLRILRNGLSTSQRMFFIAMLGALSLCTPGIRRYDL